MAQHVVQYLQRVRPFGYYSIFLQYQYTHISIDYKKENFKFHFLLLIFPGYLFNIYNP